MGASAGALTAFEVAVRRRSATFARAQAVGVHSQTHGATRLAPLETRGLENFIQAFFFRLRLNQARTGHDQGKLDVLGDMPVLDYRRGGAQILDARISARADKNLVERNLAYRRTRLEAHVLQCLLPAATLDDVGFLFRVGHDRIHGHDHFGRRAPGHLRSDIGGVQYHFLVKLRIGVAFELAPGLRRPVPHRVPRRIRAAAEVFNGFFIHGNHAGARAGLDRHVAHCHAAFDRQLLDRAAGEFDGVTAAAGDADATNDCQHHILRSDAGGNISLHAHAHVF